MQAILGILAGGLLSEASNSRCAAAQESPDDQPPSRGVISRNRVGLESVPKRSQSSEIDWPLIAASATALIGTTCLAGVLLWPRGPRIRKPKHPLREWNGGPIDDEQTLDWLDDMPPELWDKLDLGLQLGSGLTARVVAGNRRTDGQHVAVKIIDKRKLSSKALDLTRQEANVLFRVQHENIVNLLACYETSSFLYLELERCEGGELLRAITEQHHYSEATAKEVAVRIASALVHLHSLGVLHRDLKPENVLLVSKDDRTDVKLADFGLAKVFAAEFSVLTPSAEVKSSSLERDHRVAHLIPASPQAKGANETSANVPHTSMDMMHTIVQQTETEAAGEADVVPGRISNDDDDDDGNGSDDEFQPGQWPKPSAPQVPREAAVADGIGCTAWDDAQAKPDALSASSSAAGVSSSAGLAGIMALAMTHSAPSTDGAINRMRSLHLSPRIGLDRPRFRIRGPCASSGGAVAEATPPVASPHVSALPNDSPRALLQSAAGCHGVARAASTPQPTKSPSMHAIPDSPPPTLGKTSTVCGSARYIAPEIEAGQAYGHKADWYSFGVFLHALLVGEFPPLTVYGQVKPPHLGAPAWDDLSPDAKAAVSRLLHPDPEQRAGGREFLTCAWVCGAHARTTPLARAQSSLVEYNRETRF